MIPYSYNMVDMGGIDLAEVNDTVVAGLYSRLALARNACGDLILYNWKFAEIEIAPGICTTLDEGTSILINGLIQVTEQDEVSIPGIAGDDTYAFIVVTYLVGAICTATNGSITLTAPDTSGEVVFAVPTPVSVPEVWTITAELSGESRSANVSISSYGSRYEVGLAGILPFDYQEVEYIEVGSTAGPYIATGVSVSATAFFEIKAKYTNVQANNTWLFGAWASYKDTILGYYNNGIRFLVGNTGANVSFDTSIHIYSADSNGLYIDGIRVGDASWNNVPTSRSYHVFKVDGQNTPTKSARVYSCKIWSSGELVRDLIPCYRKSDNEPGMYDIINDMFYTNSGTGTFVVGPDAN